MATMVTVTMTRRQARALVEAANLFLGEHHGKLSEQGTVRRGLEAMIEALGLAPLEHEGMILPLGPANALEIRE